MLSDLDFHPDTITVLADLARGSLDLWIDTCVSVFEVAPIARDPVQEEYRIASWFVEPLTFSRTSYHGMVNRHSRWHIEEAGQQLFVHRYIRGGATLEVGGASIDCAPGGVTILDYARPFQSIHVASECQGVFLPHAVIGFDPMHGGDVKYFEPNSLVAHMLGRELELSFSALQAGAPSLRREDIGRLIGCVEFAMSSKTSSRTAWAQAQLSLREMIKSFIAQNLGSPALSVDLILRNFGLSRARLYRLFEAESGVRKYITPRRLQQAVLQLADNPLQRGQVRAVSERCGFSSEVVFNRVVRRTYGTSPGALFQMPLGRTGIVRPRSIIPTLMNQATHSKVTLPGNPQGIG